MMGLDSVDLDAENEVLGDLQNNMAKRRLLTISIELGGKGGSPKMPAMKEMGGDLGEPQNVVDRLKNLK